MKYGNTLLGQDDGYIALGQDETLGDKFLMEADRSYHFDHWLMFQKIALPSDFMQIFS